MNFELSANDYVDSTTYDQRLMLNVDAQYNNGLASSNNIGQYRWTSSLVLYSISD